MSVDIERESQWARVNGALESLAEAGSTVLGAAISLEKRLVGAPAQSILESCQAGELMTVALLRDIEARVRSVLGQVREAIDILTSIQKEIN